MIIPARYTEVLDNLLRNEQSAQAIAQAMSNYPLYATDPNKVNEYGTAYKVPTRQELNSKILSAYRFREIGFETFGRFVFELETALNEIMPYYNQLFYSADQDFNPIYNVDYKKELNRTKNGSVTGSNQTTTSTVDDGSQTSATTTTADGTDSSTNSEFMKNVNSKTPQNQLDLPNTDIDSVDYADDASWGKNNGSTSGTNHTDGSSSTTGTSHVTGSSTVNGSTTNTDTETEGTIETTKGNFGVTSAQDLIVKYRETILNIEQLIINDKRIKELFMLIF